MRFVFLELCGTHKLSVLTLVRSLLPTADLACASTSRQNPRVTILQLFVPGLEQIRSCKHSIYDTPTETNAESGEMLSNGPLSRIKSPCPWLDAQRLTIRWFLTTRPVKFKSSFQMTTVECKKKKKKSNCLLLKQEGGVSVKRRKIICMRLTPGRDQTEQTRRSHSVLHLV